MVADRYRSIVALVADGVVVVDRADVILDANPAAADMLGRPVEALKGRTSGEFLPRCGSVEVEASHVTWFGHVQRPDGASVTVRVQQSPLGPESDDEQVLTLVRVEDGSNLAEELRESQRRHHELEQITKLGSWELTPGGEIRLSPGMYALYGSRTDEIFASFESFLASFHPDDLERARDTVGAASDGEGFDYEARIRAETGYLWIRCRARIYRNASGTIVHGHGTHQDITRARDTDDELQDLVTQNSLQQAVATAANESATLLDVLKIGRGLVLLHDDWDRTRAFIPDLDGALHPFYVDEADEEGDTTSDPALLARERVAAQRSMDERRAIWDDEVRLTIAVPVIARGDVVAVIAVTSRPPLYRHTMIEQVADQMADQLSRVAERELAAVELAEARDKAMAASRHKSEFLATMSHEIRTPLNGIVGLTELLGRTELSDQQRHLLAGVDLSSRALLAIINDILDFSKIEAGRLELEEVDFEIREVVDRAAGVLAEAARNKSLDLQIWFSSEVPHVTSGDPTRLAQVITNLCSNAVKFTAEGQVVVRVSTTADPQRAEALGPWLRVEVSDTGVGVPPEQQAGIFSAFSQADVSTTRNFGGTGLGLAISREIVDAIGGEIGVTSDVGQGSTFWFEVPLFAPRGATLAESIATARDRLRGLQVLVVDDVETNRHILSEQLAWWEVAADTAAGAGEAMERVRAKRYDVLVLDMAMPEVDGLMLAKMLREEPDLGDLRLVMLTSSQPLDAATLERYGISVCLPKPVSSTVLRDIMLSARTPASATPRSQVASRSERRILVVEDNPVNQVVARGFLDSFGYNADVAEDGVEALEMTQNTRYELIFMDLQMPRMDGYATTRALREREARLATPRTPIAAMTASAIIGERERALAAGMDDFVTKPVSSGRLAEVIARWLGDEGTAAAADLGPVMPAPEAVLDHERLVELFDLSPGGAFLIRLARSFASRAPDLAQGIRRALLTNDTDALARTAHSLRGAASNVGLLRVTRLAASFEYGSVEHLASPDDQVAALIQALAEGQAELRGWIEARARGERHDEL